jgi:protein ImuB
LDEPDSLVLDITGCAHLFGGERKMLESISVNLRHLNLEVQAALGPTPGSAKALALYKPNSIVTQADLPYALYKLPLDAMMFSESVLTSLNQLGITRIRELLRLPRAQLFKRFGQSVLSRIDEVLGDKADPKAALPEVQRFALKRHLSDTVRDHGYLCEAIEQVLVELCARLQAQALGLTHLKLTLTHLDRKTSVVEIGASKPTHQVNKLMHLLRLKLDHLNAGLGIESIAIEANKTQAIEHHQIHLEHRLEDNEHDLAFLIDALVNRLGEDKIFRLLPQQSHIPERGTVKSPAFSPVPSKYLADTGNFNLLRPVRLLASPEPLEAIAMLPDAPPRRIIWRGKYTLNVAKADGPERIEGEWWKDNQEARDYYAVESERGMRLWVYRQGVPPRWFLHGIFA